MPVTAKLSKKFYERFGEDVTNELVEWFNLLDATYKSELREANDRNWSLFKAHMDQALVELRVEIEDRLAPKFDAIEKRFQAVDARFQTLETLIHHEIRQQTRFMIGMMVALWTALLIPILGLWFRG